MQSLDAVFPMSFVSVPGGQGVHEVWLTADWKVLLAQAIHVELETMVPAGQLTSKKSREPSSMFGNV